MYMLSTLVHLDRREYNYPYKNIVVINTMPNGPLSHHVRRIQNTPLSPFKSFNETGNQANKCILALTSLEFGKQFNLMDETEIPSLFSFLVSNGYTIDTSITKMMNNSQVKFTDNKILCFITQK